MPLKFIPTYRDTTTCRTIQFVKLDGAGTPGFSHRVLIDGVARDWLSDHCRPSEKAAEYFLDKQKEPT